MDDNGANPVHKTETKSVLMGKDIEFSSCGRYKIEPEVDLGITILKNEENTYCSDASDKEVVSYDDDRDEFCLTNTELFSSKVGNINEVKKLSKRRDRLKCSVCHYSTFRSDHMNLHLTSHSDSRPYQCPFCSYRCKRSYSLQEHIRTHTDDKPFTCNLCDYSAKKKFNLDEHMKKHSTSRDRPFFCSVCGHRSLRSSHLKVHMKLHVDYRPYKCNHCDYSAKRSGHLKSHMKKHDRE